MTELLDRPAASPVSRIRDPRHSAASSAQARSRRLGVLGEIAERRRVDTALELGGLSGADLRALARSAPPPRDVVGPLLRPGLHLIAEIKRRSPSAGALSAADADIARRARAYERGGAAMISVLVERHWFAGTLDDLRAIRGVVGVPVLAKEFVVDARQLPAVRGAGADAVLLLAALHPARALRTLVRQAFAAGLEPLVEAHDERELERALGTDARLIGLNNRDLRTLLVDVDRAARLRELVPDDRLVIAESGVSQPAQVRDLRALAFDAVLVGEALMSAGDEPAAVATRAAAFVAAGRQPESAADPAAADRTPSVKICGVTELEGLHAAIRAGADAIGLNFVPGTPRALSESQALRLVRAARTAGPARPCLVGVFADSDVATIQRMVTTLGLDEIQLSGDEAPELVDRLDRPVQKVLHLPSQSAGQDASAGDDNAVARQAADQVVETARRYRAAPSLAGILLDTSDAARRGGTGRRSDAVIAALVARQIPVTLSGGLTAGNVADALRVIPAIGVDVASGVERRGPRARSANGRAGPKDPYLVALFVKRARAARIDRPHAAARPAPVDPGLLDADEHGRWGTERQFGGRYVPETLVSAYGELEAVWRAVRSDPRFWAQLRELGTRYIGRPSPIYRADRLAEELERRAGRAPGHLRLYLKREDLNHTGAHKINNALGQALLTRRLDKTRVIAETGAGQHGVATATACALLGLPCVVYMGAEDIRRQAPNVDRMRALGAEVRRVDSGSATLKDAINEAIRDWVTNVATTHYVLGSAVGAHPYPTIVRDLQRVIGDESAVQIAAVEGRLPDAAVACLGGGSNAIGLFSRFIGEPDVRLVGVEAAGEGLATGRHAAALAGGSPGVLHGARSYMLQDADGQVVEAHSISAGLDYPGIGPQLSALYAARRMEVLAATDTEALEALRLVTRTEGILPALEPAHAIAVLPRLLRGGDGHAPLSDDAIVLLGLSGRGDKDLSALDSADAS
jgi:tryptophan synthase beta subunit